MAAKIADFYYFMWTWPKTSRKIIQKCKHFMFDYKHTSEYRRKHRIKQKKDTPLQKKCKKPAKMTIFSCVFIFWEALFWILHLRYDENDQVNAFKNCPRYSAFNWYSIKYGSHGGLG